MKTAFCFDLDGTLTKEEILPKIAKHVDLIDEIDLLTNITMQGIIPFNKSFKLRVRLLSSIGIGRVVETVQETEIDKDLQQFIKENKEICFIITGNLDVWVKDFIQDKYGCEVFCSLSEHDGDELISVKKIIDKGSAVHELKKRFDRVICVGDGMNDCAMFEKADVGISFGGVHPPVSTLKELSDYVVFSGKSLYNLLNSLKLKNG